jgi:hypothetical protein
VSEIGCMLGDEIAVDWKEALSVLGSELISCVSDTFSSCELSRSRFAPMLSIFLPRTAQASTGRKTCFLVCILSFGQSLLIFLNTSCWQLYLIITPARSGPSCASASSIASRFFACTIACRSSTADTVMWGVFWSDLPHTGTAVLVVNVLVVFCRDDTLIAPLSFPLTWAWVSLPNSVEAIPDIDCHESQRPVFGTMRVASESGRGCVCFPAFRFSTFEFDRPEVELDAVLLSPAPSC